MKDKQLPSRQEMNLLHSEWQISLLRSGFRFFGAVAPALTARSAAHLFSIPRRVSIGKEEKSLRGEAREEVLHTPYGDCTVFFWGESEKRILLMHGWEGRGTQLRAFIEPLIDAGFSVVAADAPGHGNSSERKASFFAFSTSIQAVHKEFGPLYGVVAHSFGGTALLHAMASGIDVGRPVIICSPYSTHRVMDRVMGYFGIPNGVQKRVWDRWEKEYEEVFHQIRPEFYLPESAEIPLLIIHDEHDVEVPLEDGEMLHEAIKGSRLIHTSKLGHRRVLKNKDVIEQVLIHLQS